MSSRRSFWFDLGRGKINNFSDIHKFGRGVVTTTFTPITSSADYPMPKYSAAEVMYVWSDSAEDTAVAGNGAREVEIQGLNENGELVSETLATSGATRSAATTNRYSRVFRAYVTKSGTYGDIGTNTQGGKITIGTDTNDDGNVDEVYAIIEENTPGNGQTTIGCYTIPKGHQGWIGHFTVGVDKAKISDVLFLQRQGANIETAPFGAFRIGGERTGLDTPLHESDTGALRGPFPEHTDLLMMGRVTSGTGVMSVEFELILEETN